jgi:16S rRNA U516 pseudouridylate synthase RsuA-like enzyme
MGMNVRRLIRIKYGNYKLPPKFQKNQVREIEISPNLIEKCGDKWFDDKN